jgi:hypothetical protein
MKLPKGVPRVLDTMHTMLHELVTLANPQLGLPKLRLVFGKAEARNCAIGDLTMAPQTLPATTPVAFARPRAYHDQAK